MIEDVAPHKQMKISFVDDGPVAPRFHVGKYGPLDTGEGLVQLRHEVRVGLLLFALQLQIIELKTETRLVRGEHGKQELRGKITHARRPHGMMRGRKALSPRHTVGGNEIGKGQPGAGTRPLEEGFTLHGQFFVTRPRRFTTSG